MFRKINMRSKGHEGLLNDLNLYIKDLIRERDELKDKLKNFKKDEEIEKFRKEIESLRLNSLHVMSEKERLKARSFSKEHHNSCKSNIQYILEGTGIGTVLTVRCKKCATSKNITDVDCW
jgi:uncharacterized membrane protein